MQVKVKPHQANSPSGKLVEFDQFEVFGDGFLIGYLPFDPTVPFMLTRSGLSPSTMKEIVDQLSAIVDREVKFPQLEAFKNFVPKFNNDAAKTKQQPPSTKVAKPHGDHQ